MERYGSSSQKERELKNLLTKVNLRTYLARNYIIQARETHVSSTKLERALEDKQHRWSSEMKVYGPMFKRIEKKLSYVYDQNQQMQKKIKKITEKPTAHKRDIDLLLYLEERRLKN